jgi:enamine deaminase RidA (YjgF/YER057c/UK114 family)
MGQDHSARGNQGELTASGDKALGAYAPMRVVDVGASKMVFLSGLTSGGEAPGDIRAQARIVFGKIAALLAQEGGGLDHLVKITTFLVDIGEYPLYNEVRNALFTSRLPASATVGGAQLVRPGARIEIEGVAVIPKGPAG